jgi:dipeptidyl aminopeptidase/acylaminoacyl peptidase
VQDLYVRRADGSDTAKRIYHSPYISGEPDWSPDGTHIVFSEPIPGSGSDLWLYSFADSNAVALVSEKLLQNFPRYSPDGKFIAYQSNETGQWEVFVISADGASKWPVTTNGGRSPVWSSDGSKLYFLRGFSIFEIRVKTEPVFRPIGESREVYHSDKSLFFEVLPDKSGFAITESIFKSDNHFNVIFNWFKELKRIASASD